MTRRGLFLILSAAALGLLVWYLAPGEEDRILERLEQAARDLEREDLRGTMSVIDEERFTDPFGYGSGEIERGLESAFELFDTIEVVMERPRIRLEEGKQSALVTLRFAITGTLDGQFGFIVGNGRETALARFTMEKSPESGWRVTELTAAVLPGI